MYFHGPPRGGSQQQSLTPGRSFYSRRTQKKSTADITEFLNIGNLGCNLPLAHTDGEAESDLRKQFSRVGRFSQNQ